MKDTKCQRHLNFDRRGLEALKQILLKCEAYLRPVLFGKKKQTRRFPARIPLDTVEGFDPKQDATYNHHRSGSDPGNAERHPNLHFIVFLGRRGLAKSRVRGQQTNLKWGCLYWIEARKLAMH